MTNLQNEYQRRWAKTWVTPFQRQCQVAARNSRKGRGNCGTSLSGKKHVTRHPLADRSGQRERARRTHDGGGGAPAAVLAMPCVAMAAKLTWPFLSVSHRACAGSEQEQGRREQFRCTGTYRLPLLLPDGWAGPRGVVQPGSPSPRSIRSHRQVSFRRSKVK
jgi:hypothetical protein